MAESDNIREIEKGLMCPYCLVGSVIAEARSVSKNLKSGRVRMCPQCGAYVTCHRGTDTAMGRLANSNLRKLRWEAHRWFDAVWKNKLKKSRYNAYSWLALRLDMNKDKVHIGLFDEGQCNKVIDICSRYIRQHKPEVYDVLSETRNEDTKKGQ